MQKNKTDDHVVTSCDVYPDNNGSTFVVVDWCSFLTFITTEQFTGARCYLPRPTGLTAHHVRLRVVR